MIKMEGSAVKLLVLDLGTDVRSEVSQIVACLRDRGFTVSHPEHSKDLAVQIRLSNLTSVEAPDLVLHFDLGMPHSWSLILEAYELAGIPVLNPVAASRRLYDRVGLATFLDDLEIPQPDWYFGHPGSIPAELGQRVVSKSVTGHLVQIVDRGRIHSADEVGFYQAKIPNDSRLSRLVYWVFGHIFSAEKPCALIYPPEDRRPKSLVDEICPEQERIVRLIQAKTQLQFFGVEFIGIGEDSRVVDVNPYANSFFHPEAVDWFVDGIRSFAEEKISATTASAAVVVGQQAKGQNEV